MEDACTGGSRRQQAARSTDAGEDRRISYPTDHLLGIENDEMKVKERYEQALRDGRYVLIVDAPTEERRELATRIVGEHGAHDVNFPGRFTIERIIPPATT